MLVSNPIEKGSFCTHKLAVGKLWVWTEAHFTKNCRSRHPEQNHYTSNQRKWTYILFLRIRLSSFVGGEFEAIVKSFEIAA